MGDINQSPAPDLVDRLAVVWREWRRDNGLWCKDELRAILDDYPWSTEAASFYGLVCAKTRHTQSDKAMLKLHTWIAQHNYLTGQPFHVDDRLDRFRVMRQLLAGWLLRRDGVDPRWARVADIGGQTGEMGANWIELDGVADCTVVEIAMPNLILGRRSYTSPRLHWAQAFGDRLPIQSHTMDVAVLAGLLEHVRNPDDYVSEAERILRPGGLVLINVPYGGAEGPPNREADTLGFRSHVRCINPWEYVSAREGREAVEGSGYIRFTGSAAFPYSHYGEVGEWVVGYEV